MAPFKPSSLTWPNDLQAAKNPGVRLDYVNDVYNFCVLWGIQVDRIDEDLTVHVKRDTSVLIRNVAMGELPVKFGPMTGSFRVFRARLTSLWGFPPSALNVDCSENNLTSITVGNPVRACELFDISDNPITSCHNVHRQFDELTQLVMPRSICKDILGTCLIPNLKYLSFYPAWRDDTKNLDAAIKIILHYLGEGKAGALKAQGELIDAGLDDFARL